MDLCRTLKGTIEYLTSDLGMTSSSEAVMLSAMLHTGTGALSTGEPEVRGLLQI